MERKLDQGSSQSPQDRTQSRKLRIAGIMDDSVVDGPGVRYVIFTQGCAHNCQACHNPHTHDYNGGYDADFDDILNDLKKFKYIKAVTFSGGEPLDQPEAVGALAAELRERGYHVLMYSGYTFEEVISNDSKCKAIKNADILIDGAFNIDKRSLALTFRGSSNQRIIDVKNSLKNGQAEIISKWD